MTTFRPQEDAQRVHHREQGDEYNYTGLPALRLLSEGVRNTFSGGPEVGQPAPDFELETTDGQRVRMAELRGFPVVLIFGSSTCPMTLGSLPGLKALYEERRQDQETMAQWLFVYIREAHPGENTPAVTSIDEKRRHAEAFINEEDIPWPVLVDDLSGTVHRAYGMLPNNAVLIDAEGRVAFKDQWASAPALSAALERLHEHDDRGTPVMGGIERMYHPLGAVAFGWRALERGGPTAVRQMAMKAPPLAGMMWLGQYLQRVLAPVAMRNKPLPPTIKAAIVLALAGAFMKFVMPKMEGRRSEQESDYRDIAEGKK